MIAQISTVLLVALAIAGILWILIRRLRALARERDALLQEKDVVFSFVQDVGDVFSGGENVDIHELLRRVLFYALRTTRAGAGAIYLAEEDGETLRAHATSGIFPPIVSGLDEGVERAFSKTRYIDDLVKSQTTRIGTGLVGEVAAAGIPLIIRDGEQDSRLPRFTLDFLHIHSALFVPMRFRNKVMGLLVVLNRVDEHPFIQADQNMLQALADQASVSLYYAKFSAALEEKRRIDYDLGIAHHIQAALLPKDIPRISGAEVAAFSLAAQQIGGDYYDFVKIDERHFGMAIADVSGKGVSGAIVMSLCRGALRIKAQNNLSPAAVLRGMQVVLSPDLAEDMFITILYMIYDLDTRELRVARAGHTHPLVNPGNHGKPWTIDSAGIGIGIADDESFSAALEEVSVTLAPGDTVVVYTDGVTEAMDQRQNEWGVLNLMKTIQLSDLDGEGQRVQGLVEMVQQKLLQFTGDVPQYDDMTLVALRISK